MSRIKSKLFWISLLTSNTEQKKKHWLWRHLAVIVTISIMFTSTLSRMKLFCWIFFTEIQSTIFNTKKFSIRSLSIAFFILIHFQLLSPVRLFFNKIKISIFSSQYGIRHSMLITASPFWFREEKKTEDVKLEHEAWSWLTLLEIPSI